MRVLKMLISEQGKENWESCKTAIYVDWPKRLTELKFA